MSTTETDDESVVLINVFEIEAAKVESFLGEWRKRAEFMSKQPGFRSFRLHRALSPDARFQLVNVAEWDNADALRAATAHPEFQASVRRSLEECDVTAHPGAYQVELALGRWR